MPVNKEPSGHRSVQAEVEVPGSPEVVWAAIATGKGMSAWFVPSTSDERVGGKATCDFGPGMESQATITHWDPPKKFIAETVEEPGTVATEWTVEARRGGTCIVRVVHRWFASTDEWDNQFEGHTYGWAAFFRILKIYLERFGGRPSASVQLSGTTGTPSEFVWRAILDSLNLERQGSKVGESPTGPAIVEHFGPCEYAELLLRLEDQMTGLAHIFVMPMSGQAMLSVRLYMYGEDADAAADEGEALWGAWLTGLVAGLAAG